MPSIAINRSVGFVSEPSWLLPGSLLSNNFVPVLDLRHVVFVLLAACYAAAAASSSSSAGAVSVAIGSHSWRKHTAMAFSEAYFLSHHTKREAYKYKHYKHIYARCEGS